MKPKAAITTAGVAVIAAACTTRVTGPDVQVIVNEADGTVSIDERYGEGPDQEGVVNRAGSHGDAPGAIKVDSPKDQDEENRP